MAKEKINIVLQGINNTQKAFADVKRNLDALDRKTKGLQKSFSFVAKTATASLTAVSVVVGVSTRSIDRLVKTSEKLGISSEFLQKFRFAAEQVGIRTETADMALQRFSRRVAEARKGTGEAKDTLTQLGISLFDSSGAARDIEEVLFDVADAMSKTEDASEMVRQSFKFFDSEGVALVALMKNGSEAMKEFFDDAENLGAVLTEQSAKGVADFADEMTRLKTLVGGLANNFTASLAPALEMLTADFVEFIQEQVDAQGGFKEFGNFLANEFLGILQTIIAGFTTLANTAIDVLNTIRGAGLALGLIEESEAAKELKKELENLGTIQQNQLARGSAFASSQLVFTEEEKKRREEILALLDSEGKIQKLNSSDLLIELEKIRQNLKDNPINLFPEEEGGGDGDGDKKGKPDFIRNLELGIENFSKDTNDLMSKAFSDSFKTAEDAMVDFIMTGKAGFKDLVDSLIRDLLRIRIRKGMLNLFSSFGLDVETFDGGGFTGFGSRAGGVDGKGGFPAILHPNETVVDHTKGQGMGTAVTFNIQATDASGFDQLLTSRKNQIVAMISQAMNQKGKAGLI